MDALTGFAQGLAQGLGQVNKTVDVLEDMRQRREHLRMQMNQDQRIQETHDIEIQKMQQELNTLKENDFKRDLLEKFEMLQKGFIDELPPEIMQNPLYQQRFGNFNFRRANFYSPEQLAKYGVNAEEANNWLVSSNDQGEFKAVKNDVLNTTIGLAARMAEREAKTAKDTTSIDQARALREAEELFTPLLEDARAAVADKNLPLKDRYEAAMLINQIAMDKASGFGGGGMEPFALKQSKEVASALEKLRDLNYTDDDITNIHGLSSQFSRVADSASDYLGETVSKALTEQGLKPSASLDLSKMDPRIQRAIRDRAAFAKRGKIGDRVVKTLQELSGNESISYGLQIAEMASKALKGGPKFKRDMFQTATNSLLRKAPDGMFGNWKNANLTDSQFNVLAQLYINAYGNEKFGSALTETEAAKIDSVFGSGWDNTQQFLKGLSHTMHGAYQKMLAAAQGDPLLAAQIYGDQFVGLERAIQNIDTYSQELTNYAQWVQRQQKAGKTDLTYKTYEKQLNSSPVQFKPITPGQSTPADDKLAEARKLLKGANLFGGNQ